MEKVIIMTNIPQELIPIADKVSAQKKEEVKNVINQIFAGTGDWEKQVDAIQIKGIEDVMGISLAEAARKNVKQARLSAEKIFDAKREELRRIMSEYSTEDQLWLKAKQIMVIRFKSIEEKAEEKARFVERYQAEQLKIRTEKRMVEVSRYNEEMSLQTYAYESMSDEMFDLFLNGIKTEKEKKDKEEVERKAKEEAQEKARIKAEKEAKEQAEKLRKENEALRIENEKKTKEAEKLKTKVQEIKKEVKQSTTVATQAIPKTRKSDVDELMKKAIEENGIVRYVDHFERVLITYKKLLIKEGLLK